MMKNLTVLSAFVFSVAANAGVQFKNVSEEIQGRIANEFPNIQDQNVPYPVVDNIIRFLVLLNEFDSVSAKDDGKGNILIEATSRNLIKEISVSGGHSFSQTQLRSVIGIKEDDKFNRNLAVAGAAKLKEFYGESGFFNTVVNVEFEHREDSSVHVQYNIEEKEACQIQAVLIESPNNILNDRLKNRVKGFKGKNLNQTHVDQIIERLRVSFLDFGYLTSSLEQAKLTYNDTKTEATIQFQVMDPFKWEFNITGNKKKTLSELYQVLDLTNKDRRNIEPFNEAADRLRVHYLKSGYPHFQIKPELKVVESQFLKKVYLEISEGPKVSVEKMEIDGRFSRPQSYYVDFIKSHSSKLLSQGFYNRQDLDIGLENLVTFLKNQGYLRARIQSYRTEFSKDQSNATVIINLDEGALTQVQAITFDGNSFFSQRELISVFGIQVSSPLQLNHLEEGIQRIKAFYLKQGFLEMKILNEDKTLVKYNERGTLAEVHFRIFEGPRVKVADIVIEGNNFTKRKVILQELDIKRGQVLNPEIVDTALDRLNRLGIFSRVDIRTLEDGTEIGDRTLIVQVQERDPGLFRMGAGANNERDLTARGFIGLGYNNIAGTARAVSGRAELIYNIAQINYPETEFTLGYLEPFLFNTRTRGRVNLTKSERVFEYRPTLDGLTSITQSERIDFLLEREFSKTVRGSWKAWSLDRRKDSEIKGRCIDPPDPLSQCESTKQQVAKIGPILDLDYRDNPFLPTKGSFYRGQVEYSNPLFGSSTNIHFYKADAQHSRYLRIGNSNVIWANTLKGGYLKNLSNAENSGVPASQAFFLGGVFTIRGFDSSSNEERIPPERELRVGKSTALIIPKDSYYGLFKSELRFPISGNFGGALFYDGGIVEVTDVVIERPYRDSVGFGIRYNTPVGPVSLDLAFKINPEENEIYTEDKFRVHFSIGSF